MVRVVDRFDRRKVLLVTQSLAALLAVALWLIVATGVVHAWMVFALAVGLGLVTVVDQPAHQAFLEEIVGRERLPNAIALQNAVTNSARITGPAIAGLLIGVFGVAAVFLVNAVSFLAVVAALAAMRRRDLIPPSRPERRPSVREGLAYARTIAEIRGTLVLVAIVGTLVFNFPTFLTLLARDSFHAGAGTAGLLMAVLGGGTVIGALVAATRAHPTRTTVVVSGALLGASLLALAAVPGRAGLVIAPRPRRRARDLLRLDRQRPHAGLVGARVPRPGDGDLLPPDPGDDGGRRAVRGMGVPAMGHTDRVRRGRGGDGRGAVAVAAALAWARRRPPTLGVVELAG